MVICIPPPFEKGGIWGDFRDLTKFFSDLTFNLWQNYHLYRYYIRKSSSTVLAKQHDERELMELASTVPFDDRVHHAVTIDKLDLGLIRSYLKQVQSDLFDGSAGMNFIRLCRQMNLIDGPDEFVRSKNIALMFFNNTPGAFFPQTQIDVVHFPEGPGADSFSEKTFTGPIHTMLREALAHIRNQVITEMAKGKRCQKIFVGKYKKD